MQFIVFSPPLFVTVSLDIPLMCINFHQFIKSTSNQDNTIEIISYLYWSLCIATLLGVVFMFGSRVNEKVKTFYFFRFLPSQIQSASRLYFP